MSEVNKKEIERLLDSFDQRQQQNKTFQKVDFKPEMYHRRHQSTNLSKVGSPGKVTSPLNKTMDGFSINGRHPQYSHQQMMDALRPINLEGCIPVDDQYLTETKKEFSTLIKNIKYKSRYEDLLANKHPSNEEQVVLKNQQNQAALDVTQTRRMLEIFNAININRGLNKEIINNHNSLRDKLDKLIHYKDPMTGEKSLQSTQLEWTPCRYSNIGWKYQYSGTKQSHLNHPNKNNALGFHQSRSGDSNNITMSSINNSMQNRTQQNYFNTSYKDQFQNRAAMSQNMNNTASPEVVKQLKFNMEYSNPPLPYIQVARQAIKTNNTNEHNNSSNLDQSRGSAGNSYQSPRKESKPKNNVSTLDGIFPSEVKRPLRVEDHQISLWAGMKLKDGTVDNFGKKRDVTTDWEAVYYKTGLFKHIK